MSAQSSSRMERRLYLMDVVKAAALTAGAAVVGVLPSRWDPALADWLFRLFRTLRPAAIEAVAAKIERALPGVGREAARAWAEDHWRGRIEELWGYVRGVRRYGWTPAVETDGFDRLRAALDRGRGAVLWSADFACTAAVYHACFHAGIPLASLRSPEHASTRTRFGVGVVSPLFCRAEDPYLAEAITIPLNGSPRYLDALRAHLLANRCVLMAGENEGRNGVRAAVLGWEFDFAVGGPSLAWLERSALFTVNVLRTSPFRYRVVLGEEIPVDPAVSRRRFVESAIAEFASRLDRAIREYPADWRGWTAPAPAPAAAPGRAR